MSLPFPVNSVVCSDWIEFLRQLPDESVQCCVTSPPYWGLRDYGTATWEGGTAECKHQKNELRRGVNLAQSVASTRGGAVKCAEVGWVPYGETCGKCGARRIDAQLGLERTPEEYVAKMVEGFREVRRVLRKDGTLWLNLGDSYCSTDKWGGGKSGNTGKHTVDDSGDVPSWAVRARKEPIAGIKPKDLCGIPWMVAFALRADGWYLRQDIVWSKPNPMPESVTDRCTKSHEYLFLLTKSERYFCDMDAIKEPSSVNSHARGDGVNPKAKATGQNSRQLVDRDPAHLAAKRPKQNESFSGAVNELVDSRNKRSVWEIATAPFPEAHFATFPPKLVEPCILAGTSERGCCPECGAPWERVTESSGETNERDRSNKCDFIEGVTQGGNASGIRTLSGATYRPQRVATDRWQPTCTCNAGDPVPCVVCDPFSGAGTVKLVALAHGRQFIGGELNPEYIEISNRRTWSAEHGGMKAPDEQQAGLFEEARE